MYFFITEKKDEVLQGRTGKYIANNVLYINNCYFSRVLNGKCGCSKLLAHNIANCVSRDAKIEDYFEKQSKTQERE